MRILEAERRREILWTVTGGGGSRPSQTEGISTGSYGFDKALGVGGLPRGRLVEVFGPSGSGKTTLALHAVANTQKAGGAAAFIDAEHALNLNYASGLDVRVGDLIVGKPDSGEKALELALSLIDTGLVELVVIDSVAALAPEKELAEPMGTDHFDEIEQMMGRGLRKLERSALRTGACVLFLNQVRRKSYEGSGDPETTAGGRPLRFHAAVRAELNEVEPLMESGAVVGSRVMMRVIKNRLSGGFRSSVAPMLQGEGFSKELELLEIAAAHRVVETSGEEYAYRGQAVSRLELKERPSLVAVMMDEVRASARSLRMKAVGRATEPAIRKVQSA